ncbi:hypothetical protein SASPL_130261 [Salvia splendens]|uniref:Protein kinase domain-containing protein n=1 Tax=Salvia splendens TaxID=180675 RepID=A0A8X8X5P5_SALSN|nr:hypothetical protein SASPL_130261 [Salvia splendens]
MEMSSLYYLIHASALKKKLSWQRRLKMLIDICRGLASIHRMNVVHCDLKSANCLVNKHWVVKICDFGLSRKLITTLMKDFFFSWNARMDGTRTYSQRAIHREMRHLQPGRHNVGALHTQKTMGRHTICTVYAVGNYRQTLEIPEGPLGKLIADCWAEPDERPNCHEILSRLQECELLLC